MRQHTTPTPWSSEGNEEPSGGRARRGRLGWRRTGVLYEDGHLRVVQADRPELVLVRGEIDVTNSAEVARLLAEIQERCGRVLVDAGGLMFIDVSGWRVLAGLHAEPPGLRPQLTRVAPCVRRMSKLMTDLGSH